MKQQPGTKGDDRPLPLDSFEVCGSSLPLISLLFLSLYLIPLSVLLARAAGRGPPSTAQRTAGRELPPAAEAREPPLAVAERAAAERTNSWPRAAAGHAAREPPPRWRAPAATERADAVRSWPRAGRRRRHRHEARGPAATTKHEAYSRAERATAGHCGGSARAAGAGRRGSRPSIFFLLFRNRNAYRIVWIVSCDGFFE